MSVSRPQIEKRVAEIVGEALDRAPSDIRMHESLIDDLGAESIDFLDIRYRVETAFDIQVSDEELWRGSFFDGARYLDEEGVTQAGLGLLKRAMPEFAWSRFPRGVTRSDLPRLITPRTIVEFLEKRLSSRSGESGVK